MLRVKKNLCLLTTLIVMCFLPAWPKNAKAIDWQEYKITEKDKAIFAFYNVRRKKPDYDFWLKTSSKYKNMPEKNKERFLVDEMLRLGQGFSYFDNNEETINIDAPIVVRYAPPKEGTEEEKAEQSKLSFQFAGANSSDIPSFEFPLGRDTVAIIANKLNFFSDLKLSEKQDTFIRSKIAEDKDTFIAKLELSLRPTQINNSRTERKKEGGTLWIMMSEIAYIKCVIKSKDSGQDEILWDYVAPWHKQQFDAINAKKTEAQAPHPYDIYKK